MKTIKKFFLSIISISLLAIILTGCFSSTTTSIDIKKLPSDTFEVNTTDIEKLMVVTVTDAGVTTDVILSFENGELKCSDSRFNIVLKDFDLSQVGSFTAMLEYGGVVSYFDYQVVSTDSKFAGGDGSVQNPYQITTAEQFLNINLLSSTTNVYFKLMNDIDMSSVITSDNVLDGWDDWYLCLIKDFRGILDGNNKKIYNLDDTNANLDKTLFVFAQMVNATIKNVDFYVNSSRGICLVVNAYYTINFENVDMYGTVIDSGHNYANYVTYAWSNSNLTFKNCNSYVDIIDSDALYIAAFVAYPLNSNMYFENCYNYGYIEALKAAVFVCNGSQTGTVKYVNSGNRGTISSVQELSNIYCAVSQTKITVDTTSTGLETGTVKQIPEFDFVSNTQLVNNKLVLNKVSADSEIVKVKVTLSFRWMKEEIDGTNSAYMSSEFAIGSEADLETQLYLTSLVDGNPTIKVIYSADYVKGENETEVAFENCAWLKYNVEQGAYVFDGSIIQPGANYITYGNPAITILSYDANDNVVSAVVVDAKVEE